MSDGLPAESHLAPRPVRWTRRDLWTAALLFTVAVLPRLLHWQQIQANDPFFTIPAVDGKLYEAWANDIIAGHPLRDDVLILGPLYPHFMALVYAVFGPSLPVLKICQSLLGALVCVLTWTLARELFDRRVALVAGLVAACYEMLIFYGGTVMIVNIQLPLVLLILIAAVRALRHPQIRLWLGCGLLLGLSALARQTVLLFAPIVLLWIELSLRGRVTEGRRLALMGVFAIGVAVPILPFTLHNWVVGNDFVLINSTGGANLYMGNHARADGAWRPPQISRGPIDNPLAMRRAFQSVAEKQVGHSLKPSQVSAFWSARARDRVKSDPASWLRLELRKLLLFFNASEIWNNRSVTVSREFSWVLRLPLLNFGVVAPFALLGVALALRRWRDLLPLYAMLAVYLGAALIFFVLSRYRMPCVPILLIFAAFTVVSFYDALRARNGRRCLLVLVGLAVLSSVVHLDLTSENLHMAYFNLGNKYRALEQWDRAVESYDKSLRINPRLVATRVNLARSYEAGGRREEAIRSWRTALAWAEKYRDARSLSLAQKHLRELTGSDEPAGGE